MNTWGEVFSTSLQNVWMGFIDFIPNFLIAVIIFLVGWIVASLLDKGLQTILNSLKIDKLFESAGADKVLARAGMKLSVGGFIGGLAKWFVIVVFLVTAFDVLGLTQVNDFLKDVVLGYLPRVFVASLVLVVATVISDFVKKVVSSSAKAAEVRSANMLGTIVYYSIWIFALIIALNQLGIAPQFMQILFTGIIAMLAIAGGLAFGLGGKDVAGKWLEHIREQIK